MFSWLFVKMTLIFSAVMAGVFVLWLAVSYLLRSELPSSSAMWFVAGALAASVPWAMAMIVYSVDGSFYWRLGAEGEEYTAQQLALLGSEWTVRHNIPFATRSGGEVDVDHVAIGPYGVLVVESKLCTNRLDLDANPLPWKVRDAVEQAGRNVARIRDVLGEGIDVELIPLVVYWGRTVGRPTTGVRKVGDVRVVRGRDGEEWRGRLTRTRISAAQRDAMVARLDQAVVDYERAARSG